MSLNQMFLAAIAPHAMPWTPYFLRDSLALWLDAEQQATLSLNGSNQLLSWDDKSGNSHQLTPISLNEAPTTITYNSKNWVNFGNPEDGLKSTTVNVPSPFSVAMVARLSVDGATNCHYFDGYNDFNERVFFRSNASATANTTAILASRNIDEGDGLGAEVFSFSWGVRLDPHIVVAQSGNNVANASTVHANGSLVLTRTLGAEGLDGLFLGQWLNYNPSNAATHLSMLGYMGEVVIVSETLSEENRQKLEGYLAHKWGLTGGLPANHPYKTDRPYV